MQVVDAPLPQEIGVFFVLHPFGDRLDAEFLGQVDQRADEILVVGVGCEVLAEAAVDLDEVGSRTFRLRNEL